MIIEKDSMSLLKALQESYIGKARREEWHYPNDLECRHILTIWRTSLGYRLLREVLNWTDEFKLEEQDWKFTFLTDLFAAAKEKGFFSEVNPNHSDWIGLDAFSDEEIVGYRFCEEMKSYHSWNDDWLPSTYWCRTCMPPRKEDVPHMGLCSKEEAATGGYICQACGTLLADPSAIDYWDLAYQAVQFAWKRSGKEWLPARLFSLVTLVPETRAWKIILYKEKTERIMVIAWEGSFIDGPLYERRGDVLSNDSLSNYSRGLGEESWEERALRSLYL
jgi:hypothetical protein